MIKNYKRVYYKMSTYYPPSQQKTDLKNITHVDVSSFASKTNLAALKTK